MMKVAQEWAISLPSYLWQLHMCNSDKTKHNGSIKSNTIAYQMDQSMAAFHRVFPKLYIFS